MCVYVHIYVTNDLKYIFIKYAFVISVYNGFLAGAMEKYHRVCGLHNRTRPQSEVQRIHLPTSSLRDTIQLIASDYILNYC